MAPRDRGSRVGAFRLTSGGMNRGPAFRLARIHFGLPLAALLLTACPPPPPPPPAKVTAPPVEVPEAAPPPLAPARWLETKGATLVGPELPEGTLVLTGGRRVLVAKDGSTKAETAPAPEGLNGFTEVVTAGGARKLIAYSDHAVYRLDDPLGEPKTLAHADGEIWKVSAGPGVVAIWDFDSDVARFVDVESGQLQTLAHMPAVPANGMAFRNPREGAAVLEAVGLAITTDGGATWKPAGETLKGDAMRVIDLKLRGDTVLASMGYGRGEVPIDFAQGKLAAPAEKQAAANEPGLIKWVRRTERDPLAEAAEKGVLMPSGEALVASAGLLARVDLKTGLVTEVVEVAGEDTRACSLARAGDTAWLGCSLPESEEGEGMYDPFGVYKIPLGGGKITPERPSLKRSGDAEMRAAPSGGVMLLGGCGTEEGGEGLCVRQADGRWSEVPMSMDPWERGAGPLADGRVAYVRGLFEGEEPPDDVAPPPSSEEAEPVEGVPAEGRKAWIVAMDTRGKERTIATIALPPGALDVSVRGFVQEDGDRRLHVVLFTGEDGGPGVVIAPPGKTPAEVQRVAGASGVKLLGNFGVAFGGGRLLGTTDGGATWAEMTTPRRLYDLLGGGEDEYGGRYYGDYYADDTFTVSDAGLRVEQFARVGWGTQEPIAEERQVTGGVALQRRAQPPVPGPELAPVCTTDGAGQGAAPLSGTYQTQDLFVKTPAPKGTKRKVSTAPGGRYGMLDVAGAMLIEGPDKPSAAPSKWAFHWLDPSELGAKPRSVSAAAPKDASWDPNVRSLAASGSRALFSVRTNGKNLVVRTKTVGFETAEVPYDLMPSSEVVFGTDKGEPIVWLAGNQMVAWLTGEQPRVIAQITGRSVRSLAQPTKDGVPVLLTSTSWSLAKVLPIPAAAKKDKNAKPPPHPQSVWLDGWTPIANYRRDLGRWPACGKNAKGFRLLTSRYSGSATVDGSGESTQMAAYDLRVNGNEVCTAAMIQFLSPLGYRRPAPDKDAKPATKPGGAVPGPVAFLRYDLVAGKAEGGERGLPKDPPKGQPKPPPMVRKLSCKYEANK